MIKAEHLNFAYGAQQVLSDVSFKINKGDKVVLLGINGSGKSTLLKILDGLLPVNSGKIFYRNIWLTAKQLKNKNFLRRFRSEVVLLFQNPDVMLFNPTVFDEIAFALRQLEKDHIEEKVKYWANKVGLTSFLDRSPFSLSTGEKKKVCLASILVLEPELLLLDEPTSNLDPKSTGWLVELIDELKATTLIATHNLSLAPELGDRAFVLSAAHRIIFDGQIERFINDKEKLLEAGLLHQHTHRHSSLIHKHYHAHESWE